MPWMESSVTEERLRFVARLLDGEAMTDVCRDFGVSRKTGYKIFDRYKEHGLEALSDRSRRPVRYANQLPQQIEGLIVRLKGEKPHWGARKIRELLVRRLDGDVRVPAKSTIHAVLDRHGLVKRGGGPRHRARGTPLSEGAAPNELWCADFKGEFKLGNGSYCYPLTVRVTFDPSLVGEIYRCPGCCGPNRVRYDRPTQRGRKSRESMAVCYSGSHGFLTRSPFGCLVVSNRFTACCVNRIERDSRKIAALSVASS